MKRKSFYLGAALFLATLFIASDIHAQWRRYPGRYYPGGYGYYGGPRVSVGIGGVFGFGRWGGYYGGPSVGVSVMLPPIVIGSRVRALPPGARRIYYGGVPYYYRGSTYYRERERGDGYEIVEAPLGATLERLPQGARKRVINGQIYYEHDGTYYMSDEDQRGEGRYIVVGKEGRLDTDEAFRRRADAREDRDYDDNYDSRRDGDYRDDGSYNDRRPSRNSDGDVVVRNANEDDDYYPRENVRSTRSNNDDVYGGGSVGPQVGDRFESLPRNTKTIKVSGETQYESPAGTRYKEVNEDGRIVYEVVKSK